MCQFVAIHEGKSSGYSASARLPQCAKKPQVKGCGSVGLKPVVEPTPAHLPGLVACISCRGPRAARFPTFPDTASAEGTALTIVKLSQGWPPETVSDRSP